MPATRKKRGGSSPSKQTVKREKLAGEVLLRSPKKDDASPPPLRRSLRNRTKARTEPDPTEASDNETMSDIKPNLIAADVQEDDESLVALKEERSPPNLLDNELGPQDDDAGSKFEPPQAEPYEQAHIKEPAALGDEPAEEPQKVVVPPEPDPGRHVKWDRYVTTILTTQAKQLYKINDAYLAGLDRQSGYNAEGRAYKLFSEHQVQQAAYDMRGGQTFFEAYIIRLHETKTKKGNHKGLAIEPLDEDDPPLAPCPYLKRTPPANWVDSTHETEPDLPPEDMWPSDVEW